MKTGVAKKELNIDKYRHVLLNRKKIDVTKSTIRSYYGHQARRSYTEKCTKTALSGNDDKVFICDDNVQTCYLL